MTSSNVSFLNSGNLLHTIFPKSQCWCVDGESKFALRIRQDSYYRIELPYESNEDKQKVDEFKAVLDQVLQYEKTPCPFARGFQVELPERPKTPPPRRPKKPPERAKKWLFDKTWMPEDGLRPSTSVVEGPDSSTNSSYEDDRSSVHTDTSEAVSGSPVRPSVAPPKPTATPSVLERTKTFQGLRSVTTPSGLGIGHLPAQHASVTSAETPPLEKEGEARGRAETLSLVSSTESFETAPQRSPSPQYLDAEAELANPWASEHGLQPKQEEERGRARHRRQISDITVRPQSLEHVVGTAPHTPTDANNTASTPTIDIHPSSAPSTPPLVSDSDDDSLEPLFLDVPTPPDAIRMKRLTGASQRRSFSPMPPPQNLFCPPNRAPSKPFTAALVRKTYELILGPPAHLVTLMLKIAAHISNGAFGFNTYRVRHTSERIPCSWESSDEDEWEEDDYGIPLANLDGQTLRRREYLSEID